MYLRLVYYILRITIAPVHDSVSIAPWVNCSPGCICVYIQSCLIPHRLALEGIYVVVVAIITGNAPGKGLSLYGVVYPSQCNQVQPHPGTYLPWVTHQESCKFRYQSTHLQPVYILNVAYAHMYM